MALDDVHAAEIKEYLDLLDLTREIDVLHLPDVSTKSSRTVIAQPGLRYAQADALIRSLLLDETFSALSLAERTAVQQRILTEIKGRMLEDIVLLETKLANPKKQVFVLQFPVGEFDMVVFDPEVAPAGFRDQAQQGSCPAAVSPFDRQAKMRPDRAPLRPDHREVCPLSRGKPRDRRYSVSERGRISAKPCITKPPSRFFVRGGGFYDAACHMTSCDAKQT